MFLFLKVVWFFGIDNKIMGGLFGIWDEDNLKKGVYMCKNLGMFVI